MRLAAQYAVEFEFEFEKGSAPEIQHQRIEQIVTRCLHYLCDSGSLDPAARNTKGICVSLVKFQVQYNTIASHCDGQEQLDRRLSWPLMANSLRKKEM